MVNATTLDGYSSRHDKSRENDGEKKNTGYLAHHWRTNLKDVKLWTI